MIESLDKRLRDSYFPKGNFQHRKADLVRIFPFVTTTISSGEERELETYLGVCGEVSRRIARLKKCKPFGIDDLKNALVEKVETDEPEHLLDILKSLAFDEQGTVVPFSLSAYPYLRFAKEKAMLRDLGLFLYEVLWGPDLDNTMRGSFEGGQDHVAHSLLHACFPNLENEDPDSVPKYTRLDVGLQSVFLKDWMLLSAHTDLLQSSFPDFLKLYSLMYQLRAVEKLSQQFEDKALDPIFFTLEWESCSKGRVTYQRGWKRLDGQVKRIFSHANTLELLNHIDFSGLSSPFTYEDLRAWSENAGTSEKEAAKTALNHLITFYRESIEPRGGWIPFEPFDFKEHECPVLNKASILFEMVNCQFRNSHRNAPAGRYANWLNQSTVNNFCRVRGRIGRTLAFNKEQLILLTRLTVGEHSKLRLHEYWEELELRGIAFDFESRRKIVELFEQLNLLEKKSDSGDAQYVRAII